MHARRTILEAIRDELEDALGAVGSPPSEVQLFEEDETAGPAPCVQYAISEEEPGEDASRSHLDRLLSIKVSARATTPEQRDELSELIESALLENMTLPGLEVNWRGTKLNRSGEGGQRTFNAHYDFILSYQSDRVTGELF
jgi:hypothetical protein